MFRLKDIAAAMDNCHERTAERWWKHLDAECRRGGWPPVGPDVVGHGANKWKPSTFRRLIKLWEDYYKARGTTPQIVRARYAGELFDARQLILIFNESKPTPSRRIYARTMEKTDARTKTRGDDAAKKTGSQKTTKGRAAAA